MSSSNVRNIESLEAFQVGLVRLSDQWRKSVDEMRLLVHRAEEDFAHARPSYWRHQIQLAEREWNEAKDNLAIKRASIRPQDRPSASEAVKRVQLAEARRRLCDQKLRHAKKWSLEIAKQCDDLLGPLAELAQQCDVVLPMAAKELRGLIDQLRQYNDQREAP